MCKQNKKQNKKSLSMNNLDGPADLSVHQKHTMKHMFFVVNVNGILCILKRTDFFEQTL